MTATDSIIQAIRAHDLVDGAPVLDPAALAAALKSGTDPLSTQFVAACRRQIFTLEAYTPTSTVPSAALQAALAAALAGHDRPALEAASTSHCRSRARLAIGTISLSRCTVLGRATSTVPASECVFDEVAIVEDTQHGCVRFSAYAQGSSAARAYRSVTVPPRGPLFESRRFGGRTTRACAALPTRRCIDPQTGSVALGGAQNGAEMGAFTLERIARKRRGLAIKFEEFVPIDVPPVWDRRRLIRRQTEGVTWEPTSPG